MQVTRIYQNKNGIINHDKFMGDWLFASELSFYVKENYGAVWGIYTCSQTGLGEYSAHFRAGEDRHLYIRIIRNENSEIGWDFFPG